ncbi:MAG: [NiFe]-hydrogenase assembly chaperone HybE [Sedimenticola sp.]
MTMPSVQWQLAPDELKDDDALLSAVVEEHRLIYERYFRDEPEISHQMPITTHMFRRLGEWRVFLVLTPWMLARVFVPDNPPDIELPTSWGAEARQGLAYTVMGPTFKLDLLTGTQKAHLNYSSGFGHYLLHPLILSMNDYETPSEVFMAWNGVIESRNENLKKMQRKNQQQNEITRREFFSGVQGK